LSVIFGTGKIMVCDDSPSTLKLMTDLFENSTLTIIEATNGKEGVELASKNIPDVILMDLKMPVMSGKEATRILRAQESTKSIPIIAISASSKIIFKDEESKSLFDYFLLKPIKLSDLVEILKKYLPYRTVETLPTSNDFFDLEIKINEKQKAQLPEIISNLEIEMLPKYDDAMQNQRIDRLEALGQDLFLLGKRQSLDFLEQFGNEICVYADNFEVDKLMETLRKFPAMIEKLKLLTKD